MNRLYYLLGYYPTNESRDGSYRKIHVEVNRKDVEVRARKGYYALEASPERLAAKEPEAKQPKAKEGDGSLALLQRALDAPFEIDSIPLRVGAYALDAGKDGRTTVVVAVDVDVRALAFEQQGDRQVDRLGFFVGILDLESGERVRSNEKIDMRLHAKSYDAYVRTWYPLMPDFQLGGGTYEVKVIVVDENSRRLGSVVHEVSVPETSGWRVSTPVLSDALTAAREGSAPRPAPLARRTFAPQGRLFCWFSVFGAAPDPRTRQPLVVSGFSLQTAGSREIVRGDPAPIEPAPSGGLTRLIGIPLDGLAPGDCTLLLTFEDRVAGRREERREPLTIEVVGPSSN